MLINVCGPAPEGQRRCSRAECMGAHKERIEGNPDPAHISTLFVEEDREPRTFGRAPLHHYNFCRIHKTLRVTPAMAAGVTDRLWSIADMATVLEAWELRHYHPMTRLSSKTHQTIAADGESSPRLRRWRNPMAGIEMESAISSSRRASRPWPRRRSSSNWDRCGWRTAGRPSDRRRRLLPERAGGPGSCSAGDRRPPV
jgi:hypothetical protein